MRRLSSPYQSFWVTYREINSKTILRQQKDQVTAVVRHCRKNGTA